MSLFLLALAGLWCARLCWQDWTEHRLPNVWTLGGALAFLLVHALAGGVPGVLDAFAAFAAAGAFMLVPWWLKAAGGGDVKMLAASGAAVGWGGVMNLLILTSFAGVAVALVYLACGAVDSSRLRHFARCAVDVRYDRAAGAAALPAREMRGVRVPYSLPIAIGLLGTLILLAVS